MHLHRAADTKGSQHAADREQDGGKFPAQPVLQNIHGPARRLPVRSVHPELKREQRLPIGGCYPEETGDPAPEHRPGSAERHSRPHADDISDAQTGGQSRGQGSKGRKPAVAISRLRAHCGVRRQRQPDSQRKLPLNQSRFPGQKKVRPE